MKAIVVLSALVFAGATNALPTQHRWNLIPGPEGSMHVLDMNPFDEPAPRFIPEEDVFFVLFTRTNPTVGQRITWTVDSITNSNWRTAALGTRFIIHGLAGSESAMVNVELTPAYLAAGDYNVVVVDWSAGAIGSATTNAPEAGAIVAIFIDWLHLNGFLIDFNRLHIAGHSLGGHVSGFAGKRVTRGRVQAIFGLDTSPPMNLNNPELRFADTDAVYVELISTNPTGIRQPVGQANFYPNFGDAQPGCTTGLCDHMRVIGFMAESIISDRFVARRCASFAQIEAENCPIGQGTGAIMGGNAYKVLTGIFYLETNPSTPFAQG